MQDSAKNIQAFYELNVKPGKAAELRHSLKNGCYERV